MLFKKVRIHGNWDDEILHYKPDFKRDYLSQVINDPLRSSEKAKINPYQNAYEASGALKNSRGFVDPTTMPVLESIREITGLDDCQMIIQKYDIGEAQLTHCDMMPGYDLLERPDLQMLEKNHYENTNYTRILLMLEDRQPGQFMHSGNVMINDWKKGDCFSYDTVNTPHGAGNCGCHPRLILRISGLPTQKFNEFLNKENHYL